MKRSSEEVTINLSTIGRQPAKKSRTAIPETQWNN